MRAPAAWGRGFQRLPDIDWNPDGKCRFTHPYAEDNPGVENPRRAPWAVVPQPAGAAAVLRASRDVATVGRAARAADAATVFRPHAENGPQARYGGGGGAGGPYRRIAAPGTALHGP